MGCSLDTNQEKGKNLARAGGFFHDYEVMTDRQRVRINTSDRSAYFENIMSVGDANEHDESESDKSEGEEGGSERSKAHITVMGVG
jgi:hypothetical protein